MCACIYFFNKLYSLRIHGHMQTRFNVKEIDYTNAELHNSNIKLDMKI